MNKVYDVKTLVDVDALRKEIVNDAQIRGKAYDAIMRILREARGVVVAVSTTTGELSMTIRRN